LIDVLSTVPLQAVLSAANPLLFGNAAPIVSPSYSLPYLRALYNSIVSQAKSSTPVGVGEGDITWGEWQSTTSLPLHSLSILDYEEEQIFRSAGGHGGSASASISLSFSYRRQALSISSVLPSNALSAGMTATLSASDTNSLELHRNGALGQVSGWGRSTGSLIATLNASDGSHNFTATIPWRSGLRFKLPVLTQPIESLAAIHNALLYGGPASVYCPSGVDWPLPVPAGAYGITSDWNATQLNASQISHLEINSTQSPSNFSQDGYAIAPAGFFSRNGIIEPCQPTFFSNAIGASSPSVCTTCPEGSACPTLGTTEPIQCNDGEYSMAGASACEKCPNFFSGLDGTVEAFAADDAEKLWPSNSVLLDESPSLLRLPASIPLTRCKTHISCCE